MSEKGGSYDGGPVGYKKPPAAHQFKKGHKPRGGRSKGEKNLATIAKEVLNTRVKVSENGTSRRMPVGEALLKRGTSLALKGTIAEITRFFDLLAKISPKAVVPEEPKVVLFRPIIGDEEWVDRS